MDLYLPQHAQSGSQMPMSIPWSELKGIQCCFTPRVCTDTHSNLTWGCKPEIAETNSEIAPSIKHLWKAKDKIIMPREIQQKKWIAYLQEIIFIGKYMVILVLQQFQYLQSSTNFKTIIYMNSVIDRQNCFKAKYRRGILCKK